VLAEFIGTTSAHCLICYFYRGIPCITTAQVALVKSDLDPGCPERLA
jgi:hypothetical protein